MHLKEKILAERNIVVFYACAKFVKVYSAKFPKMRTSLKFIPKYTESNIS